MKARTWDSGSAPRKCAAGLPSRNAITSGIERTPNAAAISWFSSELTLTSLKRPPYSAASFSSIGVSARQGAHQGAQKSTTTGRVLEACEDFALEIRCGDVDCVGGHGVILHVVLRDYGEALGGDAIIKPRFTFAS